MGKKDAVWGSACRPAREVMVALWLSMSVDNKVTGCGH